VQLGGGRSISDACGFYRVKEGLKSPGSFLEPFFEPGWWSGDRETGVVR